ncbi:SDR family oxidoreductase [Mycobacterium sp.]|uniref:SDR family oxidoreductase n=1 Tax=Mycobacterium sp. TaxID=1785 RepID=UPI003F94514A
MILVTAANGHQGKHLVPKLVAAGLPVRASVRSQSSAEELRALGVADVVVGDISDRIVLDEAMDGVEKVYHVCPTAHPRQRAIGFATVNAARAAGVHHFVYSSVLHSISTAFPQHEMMRDVEEHLLSSDLEFTILQPANYMAPIMVKSAFEAGVYAFPFAFERRQSLVDLADVTDVALTVLANSEAHVAATYELVSPGRFTAYDLADIIKEVTGRPITLERVDAQAIIWGFFGDPAQFPHETYVFTSIFKRLSSHDFPGNPNVLTWLLGREPTTFEGFVRREYEAYQQTQTIEVSHSR